MSNSWTTIPAVDTERRHIIIRVASHITHPNTHTLTKTYIQQTPPPASQNTQPKRIHDKTTHMTTTTTAWLGTSSVALRRPAHLPPPPFPPPTCPTAAERRQDTRGVSHADLSLSLSLSIHLAVLVISILVNDLIYSTLGTYSMMMRIPNKT